MAPIDERDLPQHITILGWLFIVGHAIFLVIGLFVFALLFGIGVASGDPEAQPILTTLGATVGLFLAVLGLPGIVAGYGLLTHKPWGRIFALVMGVLNLVNFPLGTLTGFYAFWVLLPEPGKAYFAAPA